MQHVVLGTTGIEVSRLCIGTGTNGWSGSSNQTRLGFERCVHLLRYAYDRGITFWDSADQYGSHPHVREALEAVGRQNVVVTTKTVSRTPAGVEADVRRFLREMNAGYLDIVLLHCLTEPDWPNRYATCMDTLTKMKESGVIRAVGVSCHNFGAFLNAARQPWVDVVLARINYAGVSMDAPPDRVVPVLDQMHAAGKGIYGMKVVGAGRLTRDTRRAVRYVLDLPSVDAIVIGMQSEAEIDEDVELVEELTLVPA
ncbi:MAG: aldo/keto reductase [Chloroflexi bacterium]|nr:aldo/keto reductase [Chloroflexota bacterium]